MLFVEEGFSFRNFLVDVFTVFVFVVTIWLLITVFMDLFRRLDISGWGKAFWVILLIIFPLLTVLVYLITQGRGMAERNAQQAQQGRDELRSVVGFSVREEIEKLDRLKKAWINHGRGIRPSSYQACSIAVDRSRRWSAWSLVTLVLKGLSPLSNAQDAPGERWQFMQRWRQRTGGLPACLGFRFV